MYKPCAPRPKKTSIVRSRSGCASCRRRRKKCDELKPACQRCLGAGIQCEGYAVRYSFLDTTSVIRNPFERDVSKKSATTQQPRNKTVDSLSPGNYSSPGRLSERDTPSPRPSQSAVSNLTDDLYCGIEDTSLTDGAFYFSPNESDDDIWSVTRNEDYLLALDSQSPTHLPSSLNLRSVYSHESDCDLIYLSHFTGVVMDLLPVNFLCVKSLILESEVSRMAALALAASNLSTLEASLTETSHNRTLRKSCLFSYPHQVRAIKYYDSAVRLLHGSSGCQGTVSEAIIQSQLIAALLFAFFEWVSGSAHGFFTHVMGADELVLAMHGRMTTTETGNHLLSCWATLHARKWLHRLPFRPLSAEREQETTGIASPTIRTLVQTCARNDHDSIFAILCEVYPLNNRFVLEQCMRAGDDNVYTTIHRAVEWYTKLFGRPYACEEENRKDRVLLGRDELVRRLAIERTRLDEWHDTLDYDHLPIETFTSRTVPNVQTSFVAQGSTCDKVEPLVICPLKFRTHDSAATYIYYALAQLLASNQLLTQCEPPFPACTSEEKRVPVNPWAKIILRTVVGMCDTNWFLREHPYHVGVLWVLFNLSTCCPDSRITQYILTSIMPRMSTALVPPAFQVEVEFYEKLVTLIHNQILAGREPLLVVPNISPNKEHVTSWDYHDTWAAIHGRVRGGEFFNDFVRVT